MVADDSSRQPRLPTDPAPGSILPERHPLAPQVGSVIGNHYPMCFGCGLSHPTGLHMRVVSGEGLRITAEFEVTASHQGAPGLAHGGLLAAACDEALGALNWALQRPAVTARLETDFRRPVPVESVVYLDAQIIGVHGRKVYARGTGRLDGPDGPEAISAAALFIQVPIEHFVEHGRAEDVDQAAADRAAGHGPTFSTFDVNP